MRRVLGTVLLGVTALAIALGGWIAGSQRSFDMEDWVAALHKLEDEGHCLRIDLFLNSIAFAGMTSAHLESVRLLATPTFAERCRKPALTTELGQERVQEHLFRYRFDQEQIDLHIESEEMAAFYARWSLSDGWRDVLSFALAHPLRPDLVARRTAAWLGCSDYRLFSRPYNIAGVNRAVYFYVQKKRVAPPTQLEQWRTWCGHTLSNLSRATEADLPIDERVFGQDAIEFGNWDAYIDAIRDEKYQPFFFDEKRGALDWLHELHYFASSDRQGAAQLLLAQYLDDGLELDGVKIKDTPLLTAFWATIALDHGEPAQDLLARAENDLTTEQRAQVAGAVTCWYSDQIGFPTFSSHIGLSLSDDLKDEVHDAPWQEVLRDCDPNRPRSTAHSMSPKPQPQPPSEIPATPDPEDASQGTAP